MERVVVHGLPAGGPARARCARDRDHQGHNRRHAGRGRALWLGGRGRAARGHRQDRHRRSAAQRKEAERRKQDEEQSREDDERTLREQLAAEEARLSADQTKREADAQRQQERLKNLQQQYIGMIMDKVQRNWIKPPGAAKGMRCRVHVLQTQGGSVVRADATQCSGDAAFKYSVEKAVQRASPLPAPPDPAVFDRNLDFRFEPQD